MIKRKYLGNPQGEMNDTITTPPQKIGKLHITIQFKHMIN